jgi:hypothetical protein
MPDEPSSSWVSKTEAVLPIAGSLAALLIMLAILIV